MTGAEILVRCLQEAGISHMSVLCGNGLNPLLHEARRAGMLLVDTRNEQTASYMADASGRLTGWMGVCAVSSAVGHTNALPGVLNAHFDGGPMLLLSGTSDRKHWDRGVFQEMDHLAVIEPITKYARVVERAEAIPSYVRDAISAAISSRPGPTHLTIPLEVLEAQVPESQVQWVRQPQAIVNERGAADEVDVEEAAELIRAAERPVIVAGSGLFYAGAADALSELAGTHSIPVVTPIWDRGTVEAEADWFLGVVGAASGSASILPEADLIVLAGARVDYRVGYGLPPIFDEDTKVLRISADADELRQGVDADVALLGNPVTVFGQLTDALGPGDGSKLAWLKEARARDDAFRRRWITDAAPAAPPMTGRHVVDAIAPFLDEETVFLVDGGNIGQWAHMVLAARRYPSRWLTCGASGVIGWGIGGGMAARLAYPDSPIIMLVGDGSFTFTLGDLERAAAQRLPFVIVVADDCAWGIVVSGQCEAYGPDGAVCSHMGLIDYVQMAESFGCLGIKAETPEELAEAIRRGLETPIPTVVHVPIALGGPADPIA